jgi:single-strand DNA-binding protein
MNLNHVSLAGYLGDAPTVRYLGSGTAVANARLAENVTYQGADGTPIQKTHWFSIVAYGEVAEILKTFSKGDNLWLQGHLETREFVGKSDGHRRRVIEVVVNLVARLERRMPPSPELQEEDPGVYPFEREVSSL